MSEVLSIQDVELIRGPKGDDLSLLVRPGSAGAELICHAVVAGLEQAAETAQLNAQQEWAIRTDVMTLNRNTHKGIAEPVRFEGRAADIAFEGLSILAIRGREKREKFSSDPWLTLEQRQALEPGIENIEMWGQQAETLQEKLLDQSVALGQARQQAKQLTRQ